MILKAAPIIIPLKSRRKSNPYPSQHARYAVKYRLNFKVLAVDDGGMPMARRYWPNPIRYNTLSRDVWQPPGENIGSNGEEKVPSHTRISQDVI